MGRFKIVLRVVCCLFLAGCSSMAQVPDTERIRTLYQPKEKSQPGDWLAEHEEQYQDLETYMNSKPARPDNVRKNIYIYGLGANSRQEDSLVEITRQYLELFFHLGTKTAKIFPLSCVPDSMRRGEGYALQVQTHFVLDTLVNSLPADAAISLCFTKYDLYPNEDWNFVFGQAYLHDRAGVWSFNRYGDANNPAEFGTVLKRTLKVASHETGHLFSIKHCVAYECVMNGSNSLDESDAKPMHYCPECLKKLSWNLGFDTKAHFEGLKRFYEEFGFKEEAKFLAHNLEKLTGN